MTCDDVVPTWNAILDAGTVAPELAAQLEAHAEACPRCRAASARYARLHRAVASLPAPAPARPAARDRFLLAATPARRRRSWVRPAGRALAVAASLGALWFAVRWTAPPTLPPPQSSPTRRPTVPIHLASAWTDATSATLSLARGVSGPATRLGRDVLDLEGLGASRAEADDDASPIDVLRRPLPGPARRAFDFLVPDDDADEPGPPAPPTHGAS